MTSESHEQKYIEFWKDIIENPDGTINKEQLMKELSDYSSLLDSVPKVYLAVTEGKIGNPLTHADVVIGLYNDSLSGYVDSEMQDHHYCYNCDCDVY